MKKVVIIFILFIFFCYFLTGCLFQRPGSESTITPVPGPSCSLLYIVSNCKSCTGEIIINDRNTGVFLQPWGGTYLNEPLINCSDVVRVNLLNHSGVLSHTEVKLATSTPIIIQFDWFK
jgi:hypothetical protein